MDTLAQLTGTTSPKQDTWRRWDDAWEPGHSRANRLEILKKAVRPDFSYSNTGRSLGSGKLDEMISLIEDALAHMKPLKLKYKRWLERSDESAFQWDMVDGDGVAILTGWTYAKYDEQGKLRHVADFDEGFNHGA